MLVAAFVASSEEEAEEAGEVPAVLGQDFAMCVAADGRTGCYRSATGDCSTAAAGRD